MGSDARSQVCPELFGMDATYHLLVDDDDVEVRDALLKDVEELRACGGMELIEPAEIEPVLFVFAFMRLHVHVRVLFARIPSRCRPIPHKFGG